MEIKPNKDNDLKYRQCIMGDDEKKKNPNDLSNPGTPITEGGNKPAEIEYFTE